MMYQCGRCGLTKASGQEMGVIAQCKCPWEFVPPVSPQRTWVGLDWNEMPEIYMNDKAFEHGAQWAEAKLKELNT